VIPTAQLRESPESVEEEHRRSGGHTAVVVAKTTRREYPWLTSSTYGAYRKRN
jgi:hypothetical protein